MARRNKRQEGHENHERWLITYADLITLLLVFFIIMYAMSKVDQAKFDVIAKALMFQFKKSDTVIPEGTGVMGKTNPGSGKEGEQSGKNQSEQENTFNEAVMAKNVKDQQEKEQQLAEREQELQNLKDKIESYVQDNKLDTQLTVKDTPRGIAVTLNDLFLFDLGKADLKPAAYPVLDKLSTLLPTLKTTVSIEGHTDNLPLATGNPYKDNWRLSSERSLSVLRYFTDKKNLDPNMFQSVAYADTRPVAPNDSDENRQKNRRVEIIVLRDTAPVDATKAQ